MAKKSTLQIPCDTILYDRIEKYKEGKRSIASMAQAGRELIEFALMIKERTDGDDSRTNRELMEEALLQLYKNEEAMKRLHLHSFEDGKVFSSGQVELVRDEIKLYDAKGTQKFDAYMAREKGAKK